MKLFSERFYQDRENFHLYLHKYNKHCNNIFATLYYSRLKYLCKRVLNYIENFAEWNDNKTGYDDCILLYYWIYITLAKYFGSNNIISMNHAFDCIERIWSNLVNYYKEKSYYEKCKPLFKEIVNHDDWKMRQELYDYYVDFTKLFDTDKLYDKVCKDYYKKIEEKIPLYVHFKQICSDNISPNSMINIRIIILIQYYISYHAI
ncbi:PIR Superfamily Protein [Plasmodium ovale curtisi]|uniref:PIR Superfamily Protein n=1 Tax=Plasmodium ovale curtisi TaxID=864141 RepID=A0A1A8WR51_PLAOA|nr:PIR Superfamily Protein [Plasmodium ovale curtisi]